jgi:t-SNARE complex subunit (syntaxin)
MTDEETVQEHNERTTQAIERYLIEVEQAETLLKRADYAIFTKKDWLARKQKMQVYLILLIIFSLITGFSICKVIGGA